MNKFIIATIGGFLFLASCFAQESGYSVVTDKSKAQADLDRMASNLNTISSDFVQEKHMEFLDMSVQSKGKFWFKRENKLRWEYTEPFNYIIIINNGKITISDDGKNNEFKVKGNKIFEQINNVMVSSLSGQISDDDRYDVTLYENGNDYLVKMLPNAPEVKEVMKEMHMYIRKSDMSVYKIKMVEASNDYTIITFINKQINGTVPENIFLIQ